MACRGFFECLLKLLNSVLMFCGLAMVGYGVYLLGKWLKLYPGGDGAAVVDALEFGRPLMFSVSFSGDDVWKELSRAWFIYLFISVGVLLFISSCFGCIGASTRSGCCLSCYLFLVVLMILVELAVGGFIFFNHDWKQVIPVDRTGYFDMIYNFLKENWKIAKWVALGIVIFEALTFIIALAVRATNQTEYDSDDEYINPRSGIRQPLVNNRQGVTATGVPNLEYRPIQNDGWSQRMRQKYGEKTLTLTGMQQGTIAPAENGRCTIL